MTPPSSFKRSSESPVSRATTCRTNGVLHVVAVGERLVGDEHARVGAQAHAEGRAQPPERTGLHGERLSVAVDAPVDDDRLVGGVGRGEGAHAPEYAAGRRLPQRPVERAPEDVTGALP